MSLYNDLDTFSIPELYSVHQHFDNSFIEDIEAAVDRELSLPGIVSRIKPGMKAAVLCGSRGISDIDRIVKRVGYDLKALGASPFIVPAMGSHGGATAEGQAAILRSLGISEETMDMPVISSMETVRIGTTESGIPVMMDKNACEADIIIPVCRIKAHTDFCGPYESGICKMLSIGTGKREGCSLLHRIGVDRFAKVIPEVGLYTIAHSPVGFAVAVVENAFDKTCILEAVPADMIAVREPELLQVAKSRMASIKLKKIDLLIVDEMGKDISGTCMDSNVIGRCTAGPMTDYTGPDIQNIYVRSLTKASHGNASGVGNADLILRSCLNDIDIEATAINCLASCDIRGAKLPIPVDSDKEGILAGIRSCIGIDQDNPRIVRITNTMKLDTIWVSAALLEEVRQTPGLCLL